MTEEVKKRGRVAKVAETIEAITAFDGPSEESFAADTDELVAPASALTFAEVAAWNRANAHLLAPAIDLEKPKRPKSKRL